MPILARDATVSSRSLRLWVSEGRSASVDALTFSHSVVKTQRLSLSSERFSAAWPGTCVERLQVQSDRRLVSRRRSAFGSGVTFPAPYDATWPLLWQLVAITVPCT